MLTLVSTFKWSWHSTNKATMLKVSLLSASCSWCVSSYFAALEILYFFSKSNLPMGNSIRSGFGFNYIGKGEWISWKLGSVPALLSYNSGKIFYFFLPSLKKLRYVFYSRVKIYENIGCIQITYCQTAWHVWVITSQPCVKGVTQQNWVSLLKFLTSSTCFVL